MYKRQVCFVVALALVAAARPASISGKIAIGTWNTQAEFANLKVVKGTQVLYENDFKKGFAGMTLSGGAWSVSNGVLRQTGNSTPALAIVGDSTWRDYTITVSARKTNGAEGFLIGFGMPTNDTKSWFNIGGWGNTLNALEVPGTSIPSTPINIQTGKWYGLRIEVKGSDIRCFIDNVKIFDTMRLLDWDEMNARRTQILNSSGLAQLPNWEKDQVRELLGRSIYLGRAARETYNAMPSAETFSALPVASQASIVRQINRNRLTWNTGWGFGSDEGRDAAIIQSVDDAVAIHNLIGVFDKQLFANNSPGTPTADASWDGQMQYGGSINYRVALHEISHALGTGTYYPAWGDLMYSGVWHGRYGNLALQDLTGDPTAVINGDGQHYWPFGLNYDSEMGAGDDARHVQIVAGLRRDMGLNGVADTMYSTDVPDGVYRLAPRLAPNSAVEVANANLGTTLNVRKYSAKVNQKFRLQKQADGTYLIRTLLLGARCLTLFNGDASNGQKVQLGNTVSNDAQRWYLIPMGGGWYKIAPKNNIWKTLDLFGATSVDGTPVKIWDFWGGDGQQFYLDKLG